MARGLLVCLVIACSLASSIATSDTTGLQDTSKLLRLEGAQLKELLRATDGVALVGIVTSDCGEPCELLKEVMTVAAEKAGDLLTFAYTDARSPLINDEGVETVVATEFNLTQVPGMLLYTYGPKRVIPMQKIDPQMLSALVMRGPKQFLKTLRQFLPSTASKVTNVGMKKFLTFDKPELQRVLLFTSKSKAPMPLVRLSLQFNRRAVVGYASASDEELLARFGLDADATPALFVSKVGDPLDPTAESFNWIKYDGGSMSYPAIAGWTNQKVAPINVPLLNDDSIFQSHCKNQGGVCFIAFLPDQGWQETLTTLQQVANRVYVTPTMIAGKFSVEEMPMRFAWAQADLQPALRSKLDVVASPGLVALNARKGVYSTYLGSFNAPDVYDFVVDTILMQKDLIEFNSATLPPFRTVPAPTDPNAKKKGKGKGRRKKKGKKGKKKGRKGKKKKTATPANDEL